MQSTRYALTPEEAVERQSVALFDAVAKLSEWTLEEPRTVPVIRTVGGAAVANRRRCVAAEAVVTEAEAEAVAAPEPAMKEAIVQICERVRSHEAYDDRLVVCFCSRESPSWPFSPLVGGRICSFCVCHLMCFALRPTFALQSHAPDRLRDDPGECALLET